MSRVRVRLPTHLRDYTAGAAEVEAQGETLGQVLADVEARYPGFLVRIVDEQDRIRPHIKCFVGVEQAAGLDTEIPSEGGADGDVQIVAALSGG